METLSWWVGLDRREFYLYIETYKFKRAGSGYVPVTEVESIPMQKRMEAKNRTHTDGPSLRFAAFNRENIARTTPTQRLEDANLEVIPYHEWAETTYRIGEDEEDEARS